MIIVKSKITGKYLKRHSTSYNKFRRSVYCRVCKKLSSDEVNDMIHAEMFSAEPLEARMYHSEGSALNSVGKYKGGKNHMPDNLEFHEIWQVIYV